MQTTFPRLLLQHAALRGAAPAMREKEYGIWQTQSWAELAKTVESIACGLHQAGLTRGEHLVVIGANRPSLNATMLAAQALGAIPIPLYQDAVATECVFPINNAEVRFALVEDQEQVDKMLEIREQCPQLTHIYYDEPRGLRNYDAPGLASLEELIGAGAAFAHQHPEFFKEEVEKAKPGDVAAMFFTSGTTGNPKGVVHTHNSLIDRARAGANFDHLTNAEDVLAYLPPAWIGQNIFSYAQWLACGYVVNCPESASTVMIDLKEIGPTYYFAPPRVFEGLGAEPVIPVDPPSVDLARRPAVIPKALTAFGNPRIADKYDLPGADAEVDRLARLFPDSRVYTGVQATKTQFREAARRAPLVHVAAHAEADEVDPLYSRILLANEGGRRSFLEAREVLDMKLPDTALVTLSACESGLGRVASGDEVLGFPRAFLSAGSGSLIASLWPVSDDATELLMSTLYGALAKGQDVQRAMQAAQIAVLRQPKLAHPFFWAPFNLIGDWRLTVGDES
jgi:hypothetical protein